MAFTPTEELTYQAASIRGGRALQGVTPGQAPSTACAVTSGPCAVPSGTSSSANPTLALSYSSSTGRFTGTVTTNGCPKWPADFQYNGTYIGHPVTATCVQQTFPATNIASFPAAAPLLGRIGLALRSGENIYGPLDAGFALGFACTNGLGTCAAGTDITMCAAELEFECGTSKLGNALMSDCGTHATPLHMHESASCEYDENDATGHSTLVGVMFDGRGLYGQWEAAGQLPADLDACNGHFGSVPAATINGVTYPAAANVYHYHVTHTPPYFAGCWGPATNLSQAMGLYTGCSAAALPPTCTSRGWARGYRAYCPVFQDQWGASNNQLVPDPDLCPGCTGNCAPPTGTPSPTASLAPGVTRTGSQTSTRSSGPVATRSNSPVSTPTRSGSASAPAGAAAASESGSPTATAAGSVSATPSGPPAGSGSGTATPTPSAQASAMSTGTGTPTQSAQASATSTGTGTPTQSAQASTTSTGTGTPSGSAAASKSASGTASASGTGSGTSSGTGTTTVSGTGSQTGTASVSGTGSQTGTASVSGTGSQTGTASTSGTGSQTGTASSSGTSSVTGTASPSRTTSGTATVTVTGTASQTASSSSTGTASKTGTMSTSGTGTAAPTGTGSTSFSTTGSKTATTTASLSWSLSGSLTASKTRAVLSSATASKASSASTASRTRSSTATKSKSKASPTSTVSRSLTASPTRKKKMMV